MKVWKAVGVDIILRLDCVRGPRLPSLAAGSWYRTLMGTSDRARRRGEEERNEAAEGKDRHVCAESSLRRRRANNYIPGCRLNEMNGWLLGGEGLSLRSSAAAEKKSGLGPGPIGKKGKLGMQE